MPPPIHLNEADYNKSFPSALDEFPTVINDEHYIDAWLLNSLYDSIRITQRYFIDYKDTIEAPLGSDVLGEDGELEISIPPARYTAYKTAMAWASTLLEENIKKDVNIFGVIGALELIGGGIAVSLPVLTFTANAWVYSAPPTLSIDAGVPSVAVPSVTAA